MVPLLIFEVNAELAVSATPVCLIQSGKLNFRFQSFFA
jgi:hypothetical protein